ncbi:MAG: ATP-grasp domain-containing protein [Symploca sp. SIO1C2]|nr:ATP-grasp domain-containing protein [Symploca sp. SIO1C2]
MKTAIVVGLPYYKQTKLRILNQLERYDGEVLVVDEYEVLAGLSGKEKDSHLKLVGIQSLKSVDVLAQIGNLEVENIISFSDRGLLLASELREAFKITKGNSTEVERRVVDKYLTRKTLSESGLSHIQFKKCHLEELTEATKYMDYPFIVKPISLTGSLCVELIQEPSNIKGYIERCRFNKVYDSDMPLLIEEYIDGEEISVEGVVRNGKIDFFGICEKFSSGAPFFIKLGNDFYPNHNKKDEIYSYVTKVIQTLGIEYSPFHIELKMSSNGFETIEAHTRFAGHIITELIEHGTKIQPFLYYVNSLKNDTIGYSERNDSRLYSVKVLAGREGVVKEVFISPEILTNPRVISHHIDYQAGQKIESELLPLNYVGYVSFTSKDKQESLYFRQEIDAKSKIRIG